MSTWKQEAERLKKQAAKPPKDCYTIEQVAKQLGDVSEQAARDIVKMLIKEGRASVVRGKQLNVSGSLVTATYYKLMK